MNVYVLLFIGLLFGGETVLIPAIYLTFLAKLSAPLVAAIAISSTLVSDIVWYWIGRVAPIGYISKMAAVERKQDVFQRLAERFRERGYTILFFSKFIYGTRILTQLICGIQHMPFIPYVTINAAGAACYFIVLYATAYALRSGVLATHIPWLADARVFALLFLCTMIAVVWTIHRVSKRWYQS